MTEPSPDQAPVLWDVADGVGTVTLNRPDRLNAWNAELSDRLLQVLTVDALDPSVRVVVLTGAGRAFSAGADITGFAAALAEPGGSLRSSMDRTTTLIMAVRQLPKPVVAAVNGPVAGAACGLALACDLVHLAGTASFTLGFGALGLMPDAGATRLLPLALGKARASAMMLLGDRVEAVQALEWGLANAVHDGDELRPAVAAVAARLAAGAPRALAATKAALNTTLYDGLPEALEVEAMGQSELFRSSDFGEGVAAFLQKRPPRFTGQ